MKIKTLLLFPPQWTPLSPHYSMTSLSAMLKAHGYPTKVKDLNIKFYNDILKKDYLQNSISRIDTEFNKALSVFKKEYSPNKRQEDYSEHFHQNLFKLSKIKQFKENKTALNAIKDQIEQAVLNMKREETFYDPKILIESMGTINNALEIISAPYLPLEISFANSYNRFMKLSYKSVKEACDNLETNLYHHYFKSIFDYIMDDDYGIIGISLNSNSQILPTFTLARMLKQKTNAKISIGGNFISRILDGFVKHPEFFDEFSDYLSYEEGEIPTLKLTQFVNGEIPVEEVPNLVYKNNEGKVIVNPKCEPLPLNETPVQDFSDYNKDDYFVPEIVLPISSSKGCYWGKCSFCDQYFGQKLNVKNVDVLFSQIKYLKETFGIKSFEFIDESMSSSYMSKFSDKLIENNLDIGWFTDARLEKNFSREILNKAHKAGLQMILWGLESGSKKVMLDINKGIDIDARLDIMRNAKEAGIWNFAFIFFGFPTETREDAQITIDMIKNNTDIINSYGRSIFTMGSYSKLMENPEKYGITKFYHDGYELSPTYYYETNKGMNSDEVSKVAEICTKECKEAYGNPIWMYLSYREILYLYLRKFGAKTVANMKIK